MPQTLSIAVLYVFLCFEFSSTSKLTVLPEILDDFLRVSNWFVDSLYRKSENARRVWIADLYENPLGGVWGG